MSEHQEKSHPVAGVVAAIVFSVILELLFAAMNPDTPAWRFLPFMLLPFAVLPFNPTILRSPHQCQDERQHAHDLRLDLEKALAQLHPLEKTAIVYCYHGGMNHSEVAHVMGLPLGTVKSHVLRGRAKLQKLLAAWKPDAHEEPT